MHCSACGAAVAQNLNYCSKCGKEIGSLEKQSPTLVESLIWAIVAITIAGIGVIIGLMAVMKNVVGFSPEAIFLISLIAFFMVLAADATFIAMLLKRLGAKSKTEKTDQLKPAETSRLVEMPHRAELNEAMPVPSVVEDTTRHLEPIPRASQER